MSDEAQTDGTASGSPELGTVDVPEWEDRRRRVERLFMAVTMQVHPHGSKAWLARRLGLYPKSVRRWCVASDREDARRPAPEHWREVVNMERQVGRERLREAENELVSYYEDRPETAMEWERAGT